MGEWTCCLAQIASGRRARVLSLRECLEMEVLGDGKKGREIIAHVSVDLRCIREQFAKLQLCIVLWTKLHEDESPKLSGSLN